MKTSNKILLGTFGFLSILTLCSFLFMRANLVEQEPIDMSDWITRNADLQAFNAIEIRTAADLVLRQGEPKVELNGSTAALDIVDVYYENGKLIINEKSGKKLSRRSKIKVYVSVDSLKYVNHNGTGEFESEGVLAFSDWQVNLSGAISMNLNISADTFKIHNSGAGSSAIRGTANYVAFHNSGASSVDAVELVAQSVDVHNSGAGSAEVHAVEQLNVQLSGFGSVRYKGNPRVRQSVSGMGEVSSI